MLKDKDRKMLTKKWENDGKDILRHYKIKNVQYQNRWNWTSWIEFRYDGFNKGKKWVEYCWKNGKQESGRTS